MRNIFPVLLHVIYQHCTFYFSDAAMSACASPLAHPIQQDDDFPLPPPPGDVSTPIRHHDNLPPPVDVNTPAGDSEFPDLLGE